jgi:hypothetical protein
MVEPLASWTDGAAKVAIVEFVEGVTTPGSDDHVPPAERVAVFDNDGTLWCEKPMPIQLDFTIRRLAELARDDPALRERQPYKAAFDQDHHWLGAAMVKHYRGDDGDLVLLKGAVERAFEAISVQDYDRRVTSFFDEAVHPTLDIPTAPVGMCRWSSCFGIWRPTGSPPTSRPVVTGISCGPSPTSSMASHRSG